MIPWWIPAIVLALPVAGAVFGVLFVALACWQDRRERRWVVDAEKRAEGVCTKAYEMYPQGWAGQPPARARRRP